MHGSIWPMNMIMGGWLLLAVLMVLLVVWLAPGRGRADATAEARRILAERYARGELEADEYRRRLSALR